MAEAQDNPGPLAGVRVLDLSRILAGPWATQFMADLGAEVIKVERPDTGDDTRSWGPPFYRGKDGAASDAAYFMAANRNKKSITVNFKSETGRKLIRNLAAKSDIVVENFRVGALAAMDLDYASLREANPRLVYCSITGFGQTGPMAHLAGYDYMIQGMSGLMSVTGRPDGTPGAGPLRAGVAVSDLFSGLYAAGAILAALYHAEKTGTGQHVDIALLDCQMAALANQAANFMATGHTPVRTGNRHPNLAPYGVYTATDQPFILAIGNDNQFARFCEFAGLSGLAHDARFNSNAARLENYDALDAILVPAIRERPAHCWVEGLATIGIPSGLVQTIEQAFTSEQSVARDMMAEMPRTDLQEPVRTAASPVKLSETPVRKPQAPPELGADTADVLEELLGLSELEIARLKRDGII